MQVDLVADLDVLNACDYFACRPGATGGGHSVEVGADVEALAD